MSFQNVFRNDVCADNVRNSIDGCYLRAGILMVELDSSFDNEDMCIYKYALDTFPTFTKLKSSRQMIVCPHRGFWDFPSGSSNSSRDDRAGNDVFGIEA